MYRVVSTIWIAVMVAPGLVLAAHMPDWYREAFNYVYNQTGIYPAAIAACSPILVWAWITSPLGNLALKFKPQP